MGTLSEQFLSRVEAFLAASRMKVTEFGRESVGDPNFVANLRRGRSPTLGTADKVLSYIDNLELDANRLRNRSAK
jgi:hypothetical protein